MSSSSLFFGHSCAQAGQKTGHKVGKNACFTAILVQTRASFSGGPVENCLLFGHQGVGRAPKMGHKSGGPVANLHVVGASGCPTCPDNGARFELSSLLFGHLCALGGAGTGQQVETSACFIGIPAQKRASFAPKRDHRHHHHHHLVVVNVIDEAFFRPLRAPSPSLFSPASRPSPPTPPNGQNTRCRKRRRLRGRLLLQRALLGPLAGRAPSGVPNVPRIVRRDGTESGQQVGKQTLVL